MLAAIRRLSVALAIALTTSAWAVPMPVGSGPADDLLVNVDFSGETPAPPYNFMLHLNVVINPTAPPASGQFSVRERAGPIVDRVVRNRERIMFDLDAASDGENVYRHYVQACRRMGVEPASRERVFGLIEKWTEVLSGRSEPTKQ